MRLKLGYAKATVNEANFDQPFKYYYVTNHQYPCFATQAFKRKYYLRRIDVLTDEGLINTKWRTNSAVDFENSFIEDQIRSLNEPYVVLEIYSSHHVVEVTRTYDKV